MTEERQIKEHVISGVEAGSIAEEMGIGAGDVLLSVNGREIRDIFDYRLACQQEEIVVLIRKGAAAGATDGNAAEKKEGDTSSGCCAATCLRFASVGAEPPSPGRCAPSRGRQEGEEWELEIEKDPYEDLGINFERGLMDDYRSCCNGCVFCFIDQMPKGMRKTLYFKDDDARLSFLQGNYVTLTNMTDREIDRILEYHLSPINVSFHTTNPELRCRMLRHPEAGRALEKAKRLAAEGTGIELNGQIVLCRGWNDGEELDRTMRELFEDYAPGLQSVSVVPVGITKHREKLTALDPYTPEDARQVLSQIHAFQERAFSERGSRFVYAGDEWYLLSAREEIRAALAAGETSGDYGGLRDIIDSLIPEASAYDGFPQMENGVGMTRLLIDEFRDALRRYRVAAPMSDEVSFCTGELIYPVLRMLFAEAAALAPQRRVHLYPVRNDFFGEHITVSGLLTGGDIIRQLRDKPLGDTLYLPSNVLRAGESVLLDDVTTEQIAEALQVRVTSCGPAGHALAAAYLGLPEDALAAQSFIVDE